MAIRGVSSNLSTFYPNLPFEERVAAAAEDGFSCVEFWTVADEVKVARAIRRQGLEVSVINVPEGVSRGDLGLLSHPAARKWWREQFLKTQELAHELECPAINLLSGITLEIDHQQQMDAMVENLEWALHNSEVMLLLEPLNERDRPNYFLNSVDKVVATREALDLPSRLLLLFDAYHLHQLHGDVVRLFRDTSGIVGHVQIADFPGRMEPGTGAIDFQGFLRCVDTSDYTGWVGLEFEPTSRANGFGWMSKFPGFTSGMKPEDTSAGHEPTGGGR